MVYGANGSGKSSLFWSLHMLFQSASKKDLADIEKYFQTYDELDKRTHESLRHVFSDQLPEAETFVEVTLTNDEEGKKYRLDGTGKSWEELDSIINEGNIGSDFINYRALYNFYNTTNRHEINLWEIFDKEFAPFLHNEDDITNRGLTFTDEINRLKSQAPRKRNGYLSGSDTDRRRLFDGKIEALYAKIRDKCDDVARLANMVLRDFFFRNVEHAQQILLEFAPRLSFDYIMDENRRKDLRLSMFVKVFDRQTQTMRTHKRPHTFLNEAMLTRFAIAIRIGALRKRTIASNLQVLVLDDMLISLDMSNRSDLLRLMLNPGSDSNIQYFKPFQKIILTHDMGFYEEVVRQTKHESEKWHYMEIKDKPGESPRIISKKSRIERAKSFLADHELDACGIELRKEAELVIKNFLDRVKKQDYGTLDKGGFQSLEKDINQAQKILRQTYAERFFALLNGSDILKDHFHHLISETFVPRDLHPDVASRELKGQIITRLIAQRQELFVQIFDGLAGYYYKDAQAVSVLNEVKNIKSRVLNPSAHNTDTPLFESEIKEAIIIIEEMYNRLKLIGIESAGTE